MSINPRFDKIKNLKFATDFHDKNDELRLLTLWFVLVVIRGCDDVPDEHDEYRKFHKIKNCKISLFWSRLLTLLILKGSS